MRLKTLSLQIKDSFGNDEIETLLDKSAKDNELILQSNNELIQIYEHIQKFPQFLDKIEETYNQQEVLLSSLNQGVFTFDHTGVCSAHYSKVCEDFLECSPAGLKVATILKIPPNEISVFENWIEMLFKFSTHTENLLEAAPGKFLHSAGKEIYLDYKPIFNSEKELKCVLVIATDRSREIQSQKQTEIEKTNLFFHSYFFLLNYKPHQ